MGTVSKQQHVSRPLFCPFVRFRNEEEEFRWVQFGESPIEPSLLDSKVHKSNITSSSSQIRPLDRPKLYRSIHNFSQGDKISPLYQCNYKEGKPGNVTCHVCYNPILIGTTFFSCKHCENPFKSFFHKECIVPISNHPYHPKHSLRVIRNWLPKDSETPKYRCSCCSVMFDYVYNCSICNFTIGLDCAKKPPVFAINHPKRHRHRVFYITRKEPLTCDVCALSDSGSSIFLCPQCDFVVHKECVYLPWIIRISRHEHRLSFDTSLTPLKWSCGVCRGKIDTDYGRYSCVKGCCYGVHSKCATRKDIWDGEELEGKPEDEYEDIRSFIEISDGIIQHFSHQNHHMRLDEETDREFDENKRCQACSLPICDDIIYSCMQCKDFILHQACAHLPRKKPHAMHPHPLTLQVDILRYWYICDACGRGSNGFNYKCCENKRRYVLGTRCASIPEPFNYQCHPHPLFLTSEPRTLQMCSICQRNLEKHLLNCGECGFVLCFGCATLPNKIRYKHDEHFLFLFYDKDASCEYWCEVCEKEADPKKNGVYRCNDCDVTLHVECLLGVGEDMYFTTGRAIRYSGIPAKILSNNHLTRNTCRRCHNRCQGKIVYKTFDGKVCCSRWCLERVEYC